MAKKMCYYFQGKRKAPQGVFCKCPEWNRDRFGRPRCPSDANLRCQIVKPKAKVVRVKAWAVLRHIQVDKQKYTWRTEVDYASHKPDDMFVSHPCTILIDEKWLK